MLRDIIDDPKDPNTSMCVMDYDLIEYHSGRIVPLDTRLKALEANRGQDGRQIELKKALFPVSEDTPDTDDHRAIIWRLKPRSDADPQDWNLLVFIHELKGEKGDQGEQGEGGKGVNVKGVVDHQNDLTLLSPAPALYDIYMVRGVDEIWIYFQHDHQHIANWRNLGKLAGVKGDRGPRGLTGPKGSSGGISQFLLQWAVDTATNQALTAVEFEINDAINDAIETMANQLANLAEDAAEAAVKKAMEEAYDDLKGEKGSKGDKGDKGEDGKSVQMVGAYQYLTQFRAEYPANEHNVGKAALIGEDGATKIMWCIIARPPVAGLVTYTYEELGDIRGPKGEDAEWKVSIRDTHFNEKHTMDVVTGLPEGVSGMYIQDSSSIIVTGTTGSEENAEQVGFKMEARYPIPTLVPNDNPLPSTVDKFLTNNGTKLEWVDIDVTETPRAYVKLASPNGSVYILSVSNDGRLEVNAHV